jgi:hypothetical protein
MKAANEIEIQRMKAAADIQIERVKAAVKARQDQEAHENNMDLATANNGAPQVATLPPVAHQKVDFSGGATNAAAFNAQTKYIRIHCDAACSIRVGATATTTYMRIPLDGIEYFGVQGGDVLSIIANP